MKFARPGAHDSCVRVVDNPTGRDRRAEPARALPITALDFDSIYRGWFFPVARWVRALGGPDTDIEDIVQEIFLVVRRKLRSFDGRNLPAWLYRITRLTVSDHRRRSWFVHLVRRRAPLGEWDAEVADTPATLLEQRDRRRLLHATLDRLPSKKREAFVMFELLGHSGEEIAELLGVPLNTVWTRLHGARREFFRLVEGLDAALPVEAADALVVRARDGGGSR